MLPYMAWTRCTCIAMSSAVFSACAEELERHVPDSEVVPLGDSGIEPDLRVDQAASPIADTGVVADAKPSADVATPSDASAVGDGGGGPYPVFHPGHYILTFDRVQGSAKLDTWLRSPILPSY